jgi:hypothetical protein
LNVATQYAQGLNAIESGGILLKAYAPQIAIFSAPNEHSKYLQEFEYTCNPFLLKNIEVLNSFPKRP